MGTTGFGIAAQSLERGAFADLPALVAKGVPLAAERDESLVSAKRAPPEEDSLEAASERDDDSTEVQCTRQGFRFVPMVIEAHSGGWSRTARQILDGIAKHMKAAWNMIRFGLVR